jgi:two-component system chemotaxis response regulator CheY
MPKAMVIDDSRSMRMILSRTLRDLGFDIAEAANGQEALDRLNSNPEVSLILCDWNMPVMNGLQFVEKLRADARYASSLIMMVTTETEAGQMVRALEAGANEYVMKPFTREIIEEKLRLLGAVH